MKIRTSYVSNSSSSSFICNVCGREESGYDCCAEDVGMMVCENNHTFCESHELLFQETVESIKSYLDRNYRPWQDEKQELFDKFMETEFASVEEMENNEEFSEFMEEYYELFHDAGYDYHKCPICQFNILDANDGLKYLFRKYNLTEKDVLNELKNQFKDYNEFVDYLKGE